MHTLLFIKCVNILNKINDVRHGLLKLNTNKLHKSIVPSWLLSRSSTGSTSASHQSEVNINQSSSSGLSHKRTVVYPRRSKIAHNYAWNLCLPFFSFPFSSSSSSSSHPPPVLSFLFLCAVPRLAFLLTFTAYQKEFPCAA